MSEKESIDLHRIRLTHRYLNYLIPKTPKEDQGEIIRNAKKLYLTTMKRRHFQFYLMVFLIFNIPFIAKGQDQVDSLSEIEISHFESLSAEEFWNQILKQNQGKFVYGNICGSWCRGCIESFSMVAAHQQKYQDQNLNYIYLWARSDKKTIRELIVSYQLKGQHYYLNNAQLNYLQGKLNNLGFPAYFLVDKEGEFYKRIASFPGDENSFLQIDRLIAQ